MNNRASQITAEAVGGTDGQDQALISGGKKATEITNIPKEVLRDKAFSRRVRVRLMSREDFFNKHASGTLRKNARVGMHCLAQYIHERCAFEFGYGFECLHETRVLWGTPITEADCHPVTEAGWHIDRYVEVCAFPGDRMEAKYLLAMGAVIR